MTKKGVFGRQFIGENLRKLLFILVLCLSTFIIVACEIDTNIGPSQATQFTISPTSTKSVSPTNTSTPNQTITATLSNTHTSTPTPETLLDLFEPFEDNSFDAKDYNLEDIGFYSSSLEDLTIAAKHNPNTGIIQNGIWMEIPDDITIEFKLSIEILSTTEGASTFILGTSGKGSPIFTNGAYALFRVLDTSSAKIFPLFSTGLTDIASDAYEADPNLNNVKVESSNGQVQITLSNIENEGSDPMLFFAPSSDRNIFVFGYKLGEEGEISVEITGFSISSK